MEQSFDFDLDTIIEFTQGDCGILAQTLSTIFRTPIYGIIEFGAARARNEPVHYVVQSPCNPDQFIDIRGIWSESGLLEEEKNYQVELSFRNQVYSYRLERIDQIENVEECANVDHLVEIVDQILARIGC